MADSDRKGNMKTQDAKPVVSMKRDKVQHGSAAVASKGASNNGVPKIKTGDAKVAKPTKKDELKVAQQHFVAVANKTDSGDGKSKNEAHAAESANVKPTKIDKPVTNKTANGDGKSKNEGRAAESANVKPTKTDKPMTNKTANGNGKSKNEGRAAESANVKPTKINKPVTNKTANGDGKSKNEGRAAESANEKPTKIDKPVTNKTANGDGKSKNEGRAAESANEKPTKIDKPVTNKTANGDGKSKNEGRAAESANVKPTKIDKPVTNKTANGDGKSKNEGRAAESPKVKPTKIDKSVTNKMANGDGDSKLETRHAKAGTPRRQDHNEDRLKDISHSKKTGSASNMNNASQSGAPKQPVESKAPRKEKPERDWKLVTPKDQPKLQKFEQDLIVESRKSKPGSKTDACFSFAAVAFSGAAVDPTGTFLILGIVAVTLGCLGVAYRDCDRFVRSLKSGFKKIKLLCDERETAMKMQLLEWSLGFWKKRLAASTDAPKHISSNSPTSPAAFAGPSKQEIHAFVETLRVKKIKSST